MLNINYILSLIIFFLFQIKFSISINCAFDIPANTNYCFGEYISEETVAIFHIKTKKKNLSSSKKGKNKNKTKKAALNN